MPPERSLHGSKDPAEPTNKYKYVYIFLKSSLQTLGRERDNKGWKYAEVILLSCLQTRVDGGDRDLQSHRYPGLGHLERRVAAVGGKS